MKKKDFSFGTEKNEINFIYIAAKKIFPPIFFLLLGLIFIYPLLINNFFILDDYGWIDFAARTKNFGEALKINWGNLYDPVINLYFFLLFKIFGLNHQGYYLFNVLFHVANAILLVYLISLFVKRKIILFILGLFFLFQYFGAEAFFWISSVTHLLGTFWILLSLIFLYHYLKAKNAVFLAVYYLTTIIALFTKEISYPLLLIHPLWCLLLYQDEGIKVDYKRIARIFLPLAAIWSGYGIVQYIILRQSRTMSYFFEPIFLKQTKTIFNTLASLVIYMPKHFSFWQMFAAYSLLFVPLLILKKKPLLLYLFGIIWLFTYTIYLSFPLQSQNATTYLISNRYGYITFIGVIFIFAALLVNFQDCKVKTIIGISLLSLLIIYNYRGIVNLEKNTYKPVSDYFTSVVFTVPAAVSNKDVIYVYDGYPYDQSNYFGLALNLYYHLNKKIVYIYSDNRNNEKIDDSKSYIVIKYDYSQKRWNVLK